MNLRKHRHSSLQYHQNRTHQTQTKQFRKNALNDVYQQLRKNFDQQATKIKLDYVNPAFDDHLLVRRDNKQIEKNQDKRKVTLPRFYAEKFIVNESIYIHQKKPIDKLQIASQFRKLSFPKAVFKNDIPQLSQRNKRLVNLCKKTMLQKDSNGITFGNPQDLKSRKKYLSMADILKQAQKRHKQQQELIDIENDLLASIHTDVENVKDKDKDQQSSKETERLQSQTDKIISLTLSPKSKSPLKPLKVKKRMFNWKTANLQIGKVDRSQVVKLFRRYLGIGDVTVPQFGFYKAYIAQGNNSGLIWKCLKNKGYWTLVDHLDQNPNFVWSQTPVKKYYQNLPLKGQINKQQQIPFQQFINKQICQDQIQLFLKFKDNQYFDTIHKLFGKQIKNKIMSQIIPKFKTGRKIIQYNQLWNSVCKYFGNRSIQPINSTQMKLHNHIGNSSAIGNKKDLLYHLELYAQIFGENVNDYIPQTVHINTPENDADIQRNQNLIKNRIPDGPWLVKPGQSTNRGNGITVHTNIRTLLDEISKKKIHKNGQIQSYIVQRYVTPMLYHDRKFDIRMWVIWTGYQLWWYNQGYLRTSSKQFTMKNLSKYVHLTNDAVQRNCQDFGKYQPANKLSFNQFEKYLENSSTIQNPKGKDSFYGKIYPKMKQLAIKAFRIGSTVMDNSKRSFQLFGLDFLVDSNQKVWLIQINNNPCLEINCSLLARLVPNMIENLSTLVIDPYFPPPQKKGYKQSLWNSQSFKLQLLYDCTVDKEIQKYCKQSKR